MSHFLESLKLCHNKNLNGTVPAEINSLRNLKALHLEDNKFSGTLPDLSDLKTLSVINLGANRFSGTIPTWFSKLSPMTFKQLLLDNNRFAGTIPSELARLALMSTLNLSHNKLTGTIPLGLSSLPGLLEVDLSSNMLTGSIPNLFGLNNAGITQLDLTDNYLTGSVPKHLCKNKRVNLGATLRYHCQGIVCPAGTYNKEFGYSSCFPCDDESKKKYLGRKSCQDNEADSDVFIDKDLQQLKKIYHLLVHSDRWSRKYSDTWMRGDDKCAWYGVKCNADGMVIGLTLPLSIP